MKRIPTEPDRPGLFVTWTSASKISLRQVHDDGRQRLSLSIPEAWAVINELADQLEAGPPWRT